ncbi:hypothetical protein O0L34_g8598 [Tuta absoluta]|nr:hypothetical protein O0L34_g8598 [Tuta absoluta]
MDQQRVNIKKCGRCYRVDNHTHKHTPGSCICENDKFSNEFRPYFLFIKKEEEKDDKWAKICLEVKRSAVPEPLNPFTKKTVFTQTYPTCLVPATPKHACCFYCNPNRD